MEKKKEGRKQPALKLRDLPPKKDVQGGRSYSISDPLFIPPPDFIAPPIKELASTTIGELPDSTISEAELASSLISGQMKPAARKALNNDTAVSRVYEEYCTQHPGSPAAVHHPRILVDHGRYVALLGTIKRGILGFGSSVTSALRAFDDLYLRSHQLQGH